MAELERDDLDEMFFLPRLERIVEGLRLIAMLLSLALRGRCMIS